MLAITILIIFTIIAVAVLRLSGFYNKNNNVRRKYCKTQTKQPTTRKISPDIQKSNQYERTNHASLDNTREKPSQSKHTEKLNTSKKMYSEPTEEVIKTTHICEGDARKESYKVPCFKNKEWEWELEWKWDENELGSELKEWMQKL